MFSQLGRYRPRTASIARSILATLALLAIGVASAVELVDRNPFDPQRRPWKTPPPARPELPALTPQDLQIEAIVSFGPMRGIVAQLDGKLRGSLPANSAGKVRIAVGQTFGAGYVLESVDANQAVVLGGSGRYAIPVVRKMARGAAPAPATLAVQPAPISNLPANLPTAPPGAAQPGPAPQAGTTTAPTPFVASPSAPVPALPLQAAPPMSSQANSEAAAPVPAPLPAPTQQPMSLLEAIQAAQAAARNQQGAAPPIVNPFVAPRK